MDGIDRKASQIICENVQIPEDVGTNPAFVKCTLLVLRGMAAPGDPISFERDELRLRTQLKKRVMELSIKALLDLGFLEQLEKPAHGRTASYRLNHDEMIKHVPEAALDRAEQRIKSLRDMRTRARDAHVEGGTGAPDAPERVHEAHTRDATCAPGARTCAPGAPTCAPDAHDIKEETAIPAKPAAAAGTPRDLSAEQLLGNAAAAAAVVDLEVWISIANQAGIQRDLRRPLGEILVEQGVQLVERGRRALERLAELIDSNQARKPSGMLIKLLEVDPERIESSRTEARIRREKRQLTDFANWLVSLTPLEQSALMARTHDLLQGELGIEITGELMPGGKFRQQLRTWGTMLSFIRARHADLGIKLPESSGVAA